MKAPFLRIVAGTAYADQPAASPRQRKERAPYRDRKLIEYQDGLPIIDPAGEADPVFLHIAQHRAVAAHYDRCLNAENDAEGNASPAEFERLQQNTGNAFRQLMLCANCLIICCPTTRRGLIHQARYLASQFSDPLGCESGGWALPDKIGEQPWQLVFLRRLAAGLRKMAGEFDPEPGKEARP